MIKSCFEIIKELESDNSRLAKEAILTSTAESENLEFFQGCRLALDAMITFGIKQVPEKKNENGSGLSWTDFNNNIINLINRHITGDAARNLVNSLMDQATKDQWNYWYRRILIKDLRCGVSEKTINKVLKGRFSKIQPVPVFECMLAHDGANHEKKITGKKLLEPKLDGVRVLTLINPAAGTAIQYTRNGKILENFSHITDAIEKNMHLFERAIVLDGEMVSSSFQALMTQVHRKENVQAQDARLMLFDIIPLSEFQIGKSTLGQRRRSNLLKTMKPQFDLIGNIDVVPQTEVDLDSYVGELQFMDYNKWAIDKGFEGIMIKDPNAKYECKRSTSWLKQKPFIEVSLSVVGVEEGTGRNQGKLGALICEGKDDDRVIQVNVGSGFTDADRDEFWGSRQEVVGQIIEIRADAVTQNQDGSYSLRFPRFLRFRGFRVNEKI